MESVYVAKLYGRAADPTTDQHYLLLEYCNSDLQKLINQRKLLNEREAEKLLQHILQAQYDINLQNIIHRDLKPSNIGLHFDDMKIYQDNDAEFVMNFNFVTGEGKYRIKFFDLGFSEMADENGFGSKSTSGTPVYSSPEQLRGGF